VLCFRVANRLIRAAWDSICLARLLIQDIPGPQALSVFAARALLLQPIRTARHDSRRRLHQRASDCRQLGAARAQRVVSVTRFVRTHLLHDRARASVRLRQAMQMSFEMLDHLSLGLGDEAEAGAIARQSRERADRKRSRIPQRVEQAGATAQLLDPARAPGEMVGFLTRRFAERGLGRRAGRYGSLSLVEGLAATSPE
jgi:hypothetical protein